MIITKEFLFKGQSAARGWNKAQIELLGLSWPPARFWMERGIIGKELADEKAAQFLALKGQTKEKLRSERDDRLQKGTTIMMGLDDDGNWLGSLKCGAVIVEAVASSPKALASKLCKKWAHRPVG